jgi:hypothetical protein
MNTLWAEGTTILTPVMSLKTSNWKTLVQLEMNYSYRGICSDYLAGRYSSPMSLVCACRICVKRCQTAAFEAKLIKVVEIKLN